MYNNEDNKLRSTKYNNEDNKLNRQSTTPKINKRYQISLTCAFACNVETRHGETGLERSRSPGDTGVSGH